jgi:hypothetical protein
MASFAFRPRTRRTQIFEYRCPKVVYVTSDEEPREEKKKTEKVMAKEKPGPNRTGDVKYLSELKRPPANR